MAARSTTIAAGGVLVLPNDLLRELGRGEGDIVLLEVVQGELRIRSRDAVIAAIQALAREYIPDGVSLVDDLIADRRDEAARE